MTDTVWPEPRSGYQLRIHLRDDHDDDRIGCGWFELDQAHRHYHRVGADHVHEKLAG